MEAAEKDFQEIAPIKKYNLRGEVIGEVSVPEQFVSAEAHSQSIKDYIVALRRNKRAWTASTKTRSEVNHTTKKAYAQKGRGGARHGSLVAPQFRGGGRVFTPRPKFDQHVRINKNERRAAIRYLLAEKMRENRIAILDYSEMDAPSTKQAHQFFSSINFQRRTLVLGESSWQDLEFMGDTFSFQVPVDQHGNIEKSVRNLPYASFGLAMNLNGYDLAVAHHLVISSKAFEELTAWLG